MSAPLRDARSLFAAAREDGPDPDARAAMLHKIALTTGMLGTLAASSSASSGAPAITPASAAAAAGGGGAPSIAAGAGAGGLKLFSLGALIATASTILGVVVALTVMTPENARSTHAGAVPTNVEMTASDDTVSERPRTVARGARLAPSVVRRRDPQLDAKPAVAVVIATARSSAPSDLGEEARLVTAARKALMEGDAAHALTLVQATRKLGARALEPEELGLEARALRALGRADDAAATELVLRRRYPDHALAR